MKPVQRPDYDENVVACPNCGGENTERVTQTEDTELGAKEDVAYVCGDCGEKFLPAMLESIIRKWSKKVRLDGNNEGRSWRD